MGMFLAMAKSFNEEVAERLSMALAAKGWNWQTLANALRVKIQNLSYVKSRGGGITPQMALRIQQVSGITVKWLFTGDPSDLPEEIRTGLFRQDNRRNGGDNRPPGSPAPTRHKRLR